MVEKEIDYIQKIRGKFIFYLLTSTILKGNILDVAQINVI